MSFFQSNIEISSSTDDDIAWYAFRMMGFIVLIFVKMVYQSISLGRLFLSPKKDFFLHRFVEKVYHCTYENGLFLTVLIWKSLLVCVEQGVEFIFRFCCEGDMTFYVQRLNCFISSFCKSFYSS